MNDSRRRDFLKVAGGLAVVGGLAGCAGEAQEDDDGDGDQQQEEDPGSEEEQPPEEGDGEEGDDQQDEETEGTGDDLIRIAHMVPDFPAVDIYVDDGEEPVFSDIEYSDVTDYAELGAGDHQIRVTAAGSRSLVVFDEQVSVPAGNTTAVALGELDGGGGGGGGNESGGDGAGGNISFQLELLADENTPPEESLNDARLRLVHASPDAPAVNVVVGQTPVFENVPFGEAGYFDLPAGDYEFDIIPADAAMEDGGNGGGGGNESLSSLAATDGGATVDQLQDDEEDGEENESAPPEEGEEEEEPETEPVFTFDASLESNGVYTAFAAGYLDPEAVNSETDFEVVIVQDVVDGEVAEAEDDD